MQIEKASTKWKYSCLKEEISLHQLSPYIGKLKSSIAQYLLIKYSKPGDLVIDPFAGSGTIPLEALSLRRRVFAADINPYSEILTRGKLESPLTLAEALFQLEHMLKKINSIPEPDLRGTPLWVRNFFHNKTLKESLRFALACKRAKNYFLLACFLGILHHQRPGFLSYPCSHLVPYLRSKKYPRSKFPELYEYRDLESRITAKVKRSFKRIPKIATKTDWVFKRKSIERLSWPSKFDCLITSPPYMNTLDYVRDNRLRLWFIDKKFVTKNKVTREKKAFIRAITFLAKNVNTCLRQNGFCLLIVGELNNLKLSNTIIEIFSVHAPALKLEKIIRDKIPDIRRARRNCKGTKEEKIIIFRKTA